ncbi:PaaI family thioesterase [Geodermatophilus sp. URMC 64]
MPEESTTTQQPTRRSARAPGTVRGYLAVADALRELQDSAAAAVPPPEVSAQALEHLRAAAALLEPWAVDALAQLAGKLDRAPGRGQTLAPVTTVDDWTGTGIRARVTFGRFHVGVGAVHGGAVSLVFDELLGQLAGARDGRLPRTAYLNVAYRSLTPPGTELVVEGAVVLEDGRKRFVEGRLRDGDRVCAEAEALFVLTPLPV